MQGGKIKLIWSLSIIAALFVVLLQAYWLYNQYRFSLEKRATEVTEEILSSWDDYKSWKKRKVRMQRENKKSYNTNMNQSNSTIFLSEQEDISTDWDIIIQTSEQPRKRLAQVHDENSAQEENEMQRKQILEQIDNKLLQANKAKDLQISTLQIDSTKQWEEIIEKTDSTIIHRYRFKTTESQNLVYDAVDLFLIDLSFPLSIHEMDSIVQLRTGSRPIKIDTISLPGDSLMWRPQIRKNLSVINPSVTVTIPYNILKKKALSIPISLAPAGIIKTMMLQIGISILLILLLIVCLMLQIQTISRQQKINKLRQNFVNTTIHELKRPVQTLKTIVSYLQQSSPNELNILNEARAETDNLSAYLQKLREVNQAETLTDSLHYSFFNLTELIEECIEKVKKGSEKNIYIETDNRKAPISIAGDKTSIQNIIINLLENAVKYSGDDVMIGIKVNQYDKQTVISISDNGIGIAASEQYHIFEPFYRSKSPYVSSQPGMGLGLSYVKMVVEAHRGSIDIMSKPNNGTTVIIKFPQQ